MWVWRWRLSREGLGWSGYLLWSLSAIQVAISLDGRRQAVFYLTWRDGHSNKGLTGCHLKLKFLRLRSDMRTSLASDFIARLLSTKRVESRSSVRIT